MSTEEPKPAPAPSGHGEPQDREDPKDGHEEFGNALDLASDLLTGKVTPKGVVNKLLEKVFPAKTAEEPKPATTSTKLTAIAGGAGK